MIRLRQIYLRHAAYYLSVLGQAERLFLRGHDEARAALGNFDAERANIERGQRWAQENANSDPEAALICNAYPEAGAYLIGFRLQPDERIRWREAALAAARLLNDRIAAGRHLGNLGVAYTDIGDLRMAKEALDARVEIARELSDRHAEAIGVGNLGLVFSNLGQTKEAIALHESSLKIDREIGNRRGEACALGNLATLYSEQGENMRALELYSQQLVLAKELGDLRLEAIT
jgi:tetratricopeptide (TPR) repeat protein